MRMGSDPFIQHYLNLPRSIDLQGDVTAANAGL
jgi:hypothetical protein